MRQELHHNISDKGTSLARGTEAEVLTMDVIRRNYSLASYTVALNLVIPVDLTPRNVSSEISLRKKLNMLNGIGVKTEVHRFLDIDSPERLFSSIRQSNQDPNVAAIIVQLPVPHPFYDARRLIDLQKDIDATNPGNQIWTMCATAEAAVRLLESHGNDVGRIGIVGAKGFVGNHIQKSVRKRDISDIITVDIGDAIASIRDCRTIISAVGQPRVIQALNIAPEGAYLGIDIGNTKINGKVEGDFDFESVNGMLDYLTPVPGGMGPLEMIILAERVVQNAVDPSFRLEFVVK